jgi:hypothetical protein
MRIRGPGRHLGAAANRRKDRIPMGITRPPRKALTRGLLPLAAAAAVSAAVLVPSFGGASSHRESPALLEDPTADTTDLYAFRSPEAPSTVTLIGNWIPMQEPHGGPNFYLFSDTARYNLNVDRTGDGRWDVRYQYRFTTRAPKSDAAGYLYTDPSGNVLVKQVYDLYRITRDSDGDVTSTKRIARNRATSPNNSGPKSIPAYATFRQQAVHSLKGGVKTFAGQADDPFFVDLGMIFDLVNLDKPGRAGIGFGNAGNGVDSVARYNVHTIALQVPISDVKGKGDVIGVFASTERPVTEHVVTKRSRTVQGVRVATRAVTKRTTWTQVSRLGNPLVNEVVIPRYLKDQWNADDPSTDAEYRKHYRQPFVAAALNALFPTLGLNIPEKGRADVATGLLNGLDLSALGLADNSTGKTSADLLRLNVTTPVSASPKPLGEIQGDPQGFPNGRRLADDVVDAELRIIGGNLFNLVGGTANKLPLGDGVNQNDVAFEAAFPYVAPAHDGFTTAPPHYRAEPAAPAVGPLP